MHLVDCVRRNENGIDRTFDIYAVELSEIRTSHTEKSKRFGEHEARAFDTIARNNRDGSVPFAVELRQIDCRHGLRVEVVPSDQCFHRVLVCSPSPVAYSVESHPISRMVQPDDYSVVSDAIST